VDAAFWKKLHKLVTIVLPNWSCREARYIYILTILLVVRTLMSIWLADVNGRVVKAIVNKSFSDFLKKVSAHHQP
jgi:ATP-binding cassette subfamily D (ALD) long-chain fatty acid import protein